MRANMAERRARHDPDAGRPRGRLILGVALAAMLCGALAGCGEQSRPEFLVRLQEDCRSGDEDACGLLATPAARPVVPRNSQSTLRPRSSVQRDVEAIMRGMDRTRASPRVRAAPPGGE